jgi:hypothetical protein
MIVLAWLLAPFLIVAAAIFVVCQRTELRAARARNAAGLVILCALPALMSLGALMWGPPILGQYIGMRDEPFMWAPFAGLAVAVSLPIALRWTRRRK